MNHEMPLALWSSLAFDPRRAPGCHPVLKGKRVVGSQDLNLTTSVGGWCQSAAYQFTMR